MNFKDVAKKASHAFMTEDPEPKQESTQGAVAARIPSFNQPPQIAANSPFAIPSTSVLDENVYNSVLAKTNFDTTDVGKVIHKYFDALEETGLDVQTKFKSAMKQAAKLDGISPAKVLATFDSLKNSLQNEANAFGGAAAKNEQDQVTSRKNSLADIENQIKRLTEQRTKVMAELADAQQTLANATTQFNLASQRRATEIDQQKAQFAALLA